MKPAPFSLLIPDTIDEAVSALAEYGDAARVIAGGQSLMAMMNMRLAEPDYLIDIARINELKRIEVTPEGVSVGAAVTQSAPTRSLYPPSSRPLPRTPAQDSTR